MSLEGHARLVVQGEPEAPGAFGRGCALLLEGVEAERSLNRAAKRLGMAYSKAWRLVNEAEDQVGFKLIDRDGARGSTLTPEGRRALAGYRTLQAEIDELVSRRLPELLC
ncbi:MAG: LysR family transcriptional regulator [Coriobacteriaceae bacterium]|nr:LysR family transcriptional regulator [Coriobacteriaceae bacterium]